MIDFIKLRILSRRGEGYIEMVIGVFASMMVIVAAINIFSFLSLKEDLDYFAKQIIDTATQMGAVGDEVYNRYDDLCEETGLSPEMDFTGTEYYNETTKTVQLADKIKVTLTAETEVFGLGVFKIPVTVKSSYSGISRGYHK